jgi:hypothetical protein
MLPPLVLSHDELRALMALEHDPPSPRRLAQRCRMVFLAAQGWSVAAIAHELGLSAVTVHIWLRRYQQLGVAGLADLAPPATPCAGSDHDQSTPPKVASTPGRSAARWTRTRA